MTYLQLPRLDPRIPALAEKVTASSTTNYGRAKTIESYLRQNIGYTLELPGVESDPLANFLFQRKKGHCEYFASSMVIMLRTLGIPARVVNGFRGGEYNDLNQTYIIRGRDAHSWVEVYFPEYGWVTFDPTPSSPAGEQNDVWSRIGLYMDAARELWREWIINYDFSHQLRLSAQLGKQSSYVQNKVRFWSWMKYRRMIMHLKTMQGGELSSKKIGALVALLFVIAVLPFAPRIWRRFQQARVARNPQEAPKTAASFWYTRMLRAMERRGIRKSPMQTPEEFASAIADPEIQRDVVVFTEYYGSVVSGVGSSETVSYLVLARSRASVNGMRIWGLWSRTSRWPLTMPSISSEICRSSSRLSLTIVSLQEVDPRLAVVRNGCDFHFVAFR